MTLITDIFALLGSITLFLFGLTKLSEDTGKLCEGKTNGVIRRATKTRLGGFLAGSCATSVLQSSVATNVIAITLVEKGVIDFFACAAVIMGTNVGTTVTAQLVSLSAIFDFAPQTIGGVVAFFGFCLSRLKNDKLKALGGALLGFGLLFVGLGFMTDTAEKFKKYLWFTSLFLVDNPFILFLNGIAVTAVLQSSSVFTSIVVVLASVGLVNFDCAAFMILGSNIGTCLPVIFASANMSNEARKAALFNLLFNLFGSLLFFAPLLCGKIGLLPFFSSVDQGRNIANFHTFFNGAVSLILLPIIKPFCKLCDRLFSMLNVDNLHNKKPVFVRKNV